MAADTCLAKIILPVELWCPHCGARHVDEERNGIKWHRRVHTTHRCQRCGRDWDVYVSGARPPKGAPGRLGRLKSKPLRGLVAALLVVAYAAGFLLGALAF